eukprot:954656-Amorphochlora_amoeboformis.AAC.1
MGVLTVKTRCLDSLTVKTRCLDSQDLRRGVSTVKKWGVFDNQDAMLGGRCQVFLGIRGFDPKPAISGFRSLLSRPPILKPVRRPKLNQTRANRDSKAAMGCSIDRTAVYPDMGMQHLKTSTKSESAQVEIHADYRV